MKAQQFKTLRGNAVYYTLDNKIVLSNEVDMSKDFNVTFEVNNQFASKNRINKFILELTQDCNLRCQYCCYSGNYKGMRQHNPYKMSDSIIDNTISFICDHYDQKSDSIYVCFYGGEALLCLKEIKYIVSILSNRFGDFVHFSISTNGLALSSEVVDWICSIRGIQVVISIDGDKQMHDLYRKQINGLGSYERIMNNLRYFREKYPDEFIKRIIILSTLPNINEIKHLDNVWSNTLVGDIIPKVSTFNPNFSDPSVELLNLKNADIFYKKAFFHYIQGKDTIMYRCLKALIRPAENRELSVYENKMTVNTCLNDIKSCFVDVNGTLYACEKVCSRLDIGNVMNGFVFEKIESINLLYVNRMNNMCKDCWAMRLCPKCILNLNYSDEEMKKLCEIERGRLLLMLKYYCLVKDWDSYTKIKTK